ncbi:MAG: flagellar biosynthetic protein FliR [Syntrophorhabdaceae bacterium]|nr:flagellar biosynthetic protein FliR [Syntrophorhabdaceae bacterium]
MGDIGFLSVKFILIFFRVISILWLLPIFSSRAVSALFKAGLSLAITYLLIDWINVDIGEGEGPYFLMLLVMKEVFIGLTIGFFVRILFFMVYGAGEIISLQTGFSFARFMDPLSMTQISVIEQLQNILAIFVFFSIDGHHSLIKGIFLSFREVPIGTLSLNEGILRYLINGVGKIFSVGMKIGAPVIATLFVVELSLGLLSRLLPQMNIFIEGMPMKILIAFMVLSFSMSFTVSAIDGLFRGLEGEILRLMRMMV